MFVVPVASSGRIRFTFELVKLLCGFLVGLFLLVQVELMQQGGVDVLQTVHLPPCLSQLFGTRCCLLAQLADTLQQLIDLQVLLQDESLEVLVIVGVLASDASRQHALEHLNLSLFHKQLLFEIRFLSVELLPFPVKASQ